jgi:hypothetical protein
MPQVIPEARPKALGLSMGKGENIEVECSTGEVTGFRCQVSDISICKLFYFET